MIIKRNLGKLTEKQEHEVDCLCDAIFDKVYIYDPQPCYLIAHDEKGNTILECENSFEDFLDERKLIL